MKLHTYMVLSLVTLLNSHATVTINSLRVEGHKTSTAAGDSPITNNTTLALLVLDSGGDGFGRIRDKQTIMINSLIGDGNDVILDVFSTSSAGLGDASIQRTQFTLDLGSSIAGLDRDTGDHFAIFWLPTLTTASASFTLGDTYGIAFTPRDTLNPTNPANDTAWALPPENATLSPITVSEAGNADFTVIAVPEPSSTALLGLGALALIGRRKRG